MGNKGRGEKTKMNKGRREGQGERANNNKEFSYVFVWCLFRSLIGPKSGQNPKKKKHPNLQPHCFIFFFEICFSKRWETTLEQQSFFCSLGPSSLGKPFVREIGKKVFLSPTWITQLCIIILLQVWSDSNCPFMTTPCILTR